MSGKNSKRRQPNYLLSITYVVGLLEYCLGTLCRCWCKLLLLLLLLKVACRTNLYCYNIWLEISPSVGWRTVPGTAGWKGLPILGIVGKLKLASVVVKVG